MPLHIFGIRHHGPGSARNVVAALNEVRPDIVLIEGPPEGDVLLQWVAHTDMQPPVALLAYATDQPQNAVFYPFATYSPEWQAIRWALENKVPVRFMDMPLVHKLAMRPTDDAEPPEAAPDTEATAPLANDEATEPDPNALPLVPNPMQYLAETAGYADSEAWWDQHFERGAQPIEIFGAINDAMAALRETFASHDGDNPVREAFMRRAIRTAERELYSTIAVVCGAWHAPALQKPEEHRKNDDNLLKNLPKTKVEATWMPWTNDRLLFISGYGAGIESPGWYAHTWEHPTDRDGTLWLTKAAHAFRAAEKDISSAHVIEAVRLVQALSTMRQLPYPGLDELNEAIQTVMCMGEAEPLALLRGPLLVGNRLGQVPSGVPQTPLQADFERQLGKLRFKIAESAKDIELDLREEGSRQRSVFLHRLQLLEIGWGSMATARGKGTYKENWTLYWRPEMMIALVEKAPWGNTIEAAANAFVLQRAEQATDLAQVLLLLNATLPSELPAATEAVVRRMDQLASGTTDIAVLLEAIPPLVDLKKYGNVRQSDTELIGFILNSLFYRLLAGLPVGCSGIDEQQATEMSNHIQKAHQAVLLLDDAAYRTDWGSTLQVILDNPLSAPFLQGTCCKLLYDSQFLDAERTAAQFSLALSSAQPPTVSVQWLEGFLSNAAMVLLLDERIWGMVDQWMADIDDDAFQAVLPLLRRTFSGYSGAEKRKIAAKAKRTNTTGNAGPMAEQAEYFNMERAARVLPILEKILTE
jgi:hypothetical protein